jgi:hypothetical protein
MRAIFCVVLSLFAPFVWAGFENGNAGDAFSSEFILSGRDIVQRLELLTKSGKTIYDTTNLRVALTTTEVVSDEHVFLNGYERDAVNYFPTQRLIKMGRARWRELRRSTETKARLQLVLHEYLWVSGENDTNFAVSQRLISFLNISNYSPDVWWNPVNPMNYVVPTLSFAPAGCVIAPGKLDVKSSDETVEIESTGSCGDAYRKLRIVKTAGVTPASSNVRGLFHKFELTVFDKTARPLGQMVFEPEWGKCLLPEDGTCQVSGKFTIGDVEMVFWFLRE